MTDRSNLNLGASEQRPERTTLLIAPVMRISMGTCSWDYITNEEDLPFLVLAAQAHCRQIDARRKRQYAF